MRQGPVVIGNEVLIGSHSVIQGPCYIGGKSRVESALIRPGTTLGPGCRVSGEIESSVFQGWSNKQHNGFIGHSWVGEWVNLGAGTNASDLKNNYGQVRFGAESSAVDTGMLKLGCFIGDHAKTGIGCLLSAGAVIGPFSQLLGGAISPKYIPPFSWQAPDGFKTHRLEDALETAKAVMSRRSKELGETYEKMVRDLFQQVRRSGE
jgi:UDP-N-acetylglucosamine diphosphorylase/glucosamine-1-phosphate N-acetyltransferase